MVLYVCVNALGFTLGASKSFTYCSSISSVSNAFSFYKDYLHVGRETCACLWKTF